MPFTSIMMLYINNDGSLFYNRNRSSECFYKAELTAFVPILGLFSMPQEEFFTILKDRILW